MQKRTDSMARIIDVSHYQGVIDWDTVRASGISGMFAKASQGSDMVDDTFASNIAGAKAAGLLVGAYHFLSAASIVDAEQEARHFVDVINSVGGVSALDFPLVMDYENNPEGLGQPGINAIAKAFLAAVAELTGERAIIYTGNAFARNFDAWAGAYELWIARYTEDMDVFPQDAGPWTAWDFWQYSESGSIDGIPDNQVDLNVFNGTEAALRAKYTKEDDVMQLTDAQWEQLYTVLDGLYHKAVDEGDPAGLSDWGWAQKAVDRTLTVSEALYLSLVLHGRAQGVQDV